MTTVEAGFPKTARLRRRPEFLNLSRSGKKLHTANFVIITRVTDGSESRLGITVSSKVGNAVVRNRIKRLLRECFRRLRHQILPSQDILIVARKGAACMSLAQVVGEIGVCLSHLRSHENKRWNGPFDKS